MIRRSAFTYRRNYWAAWILEVFGRLFLAPILRLFRHRPSVEVRNILVVRLDNLGDVLMATPAIHALRERFPEARLTCLVKPAAAEVLRNNPDVNDQVFFDAPWYPQDNLWFLRHEGRKRFRAAVRQLRHRRFDLAVHLKPFKYHADLFLMAVSGAPRRVGFAHKGGACFLTDVVPQEGEKHVIQSALDVARHLGADVCDESLRFPLSEQARENARRLLAREGLERTDDTEEAIQNSQGAARGLRLGLLNQEGPLVCLSPTASHNLIWTEEGFAAVARWLVDRFRARVFFVGMAQDAQMVERIRRAAERPTASLVGQTDVATLAAVIECSDLVVSVCSFARHLAAAVGTALVFLRHGGDSNTIIGPYGERHWMVFRPVPCAPCGLVDGCDTCHCMTDITPGEVISEIERRAPEIFDS